MTAVSSPTRIPRSYALRSDRPNAAVSPTSPWAIAAHTSKRASAASSPSRSARASPSCAQTTAPCRSKVTPSVFTTNSRASRSAASSPDDRASASDSRSRRAVHAPYAAVVWSSAGEWTVAHMSVRATSASSTTEPSSSTLSMSGSSVAWAPGERARSGAAMTASCSAASWWPVEMRRSSAASTSGHERDAVVGSSVHCLDQYAACASRTPFSVPDSASSRWQ